jgi:hypothetical protein
VRDLGSKREETGWEDRGEVKVVLIHPEFSAPTSSVVKSTF